MLPKLPKSQDYLSSTRVNISTNKNEEFLFIINIEDKLIVLFYATN